MHNVWPIIRPYIWPASLPIRAEFTQGRAGREVGGDGGVPSRLLLDLSYTLNFHDPVLLFLLSGSSQGWLESDLPGF